MCGRATPSTCRFNERSVDFYTIKLLFGALFWFVCIVLESLRLLAYDPVCVRPCSYPRRPCFMLYLSQ
jgi:hypothetical protein